MIDPLNEKFLFKSLLKYSKKRLLYLRHHSPFQQFSVIFFGAQLYSLLSEQLLSFPQLTASLYFKDHVNGFGCITAFVFGPVTRLLSGEQFLGIPALIKWPGYDESVDYTNILSFIRSKRLSCCLKIFTLEQILKTLGMDMLPCSTHIIRREN
jgi:hypothetical protein